MKNTYKGLLIKRKEGTNQLLFEEIEINRNKSLEELYQYLDCSTIDIQTRYINNRLYDFIFDDEYIINGKAQDPNKAVAIGSQKAELLEIIFGTLFICGLADEEGRETDLTQEDIFNITHAIRYFYNTKAKKSYQTINYHFKYTPKATK